MIAGRRLALLPALALAGACSSLSVPNPYRCTYDLSRKGFLDELVFAQATPRTLQFDDYTPGSYDVEPLDLLEGVDGLAQTNGARPVALFVSGPYGPVWAYEVSVVIPGPDAELVATTLVMAHARIVYKATKRIDARTLSDLRSQFEGGDLVAGLPARADDFGFLAAFWDGSDRTLFHVPASWYSETESEALSYAARLLEGLFQGATATYSADLPESSPTQICGEG